MTRIDGRQKNELRPITITRGYTKHAQGSVLMEMGETKVLCTAFYESKVPSFLKGTGKGWISAEYSMLPSSTITRKPRDISRLKMDGRSSEIQRLVGRSLRSAVDLEALGENTIWIDCDVLQADGGTRTASIIGGFVALMDAVNKMMKDGVIEKNPVKDFVGAVSVGVVSDEVLVDLCYSEDSNAQVDMNVVMTSSGGIVEIQGTGEERPMSESEFNALVKLAKESIQKITSIQKNALKEERS